MDWLALQYLLYQIILYHVLDQERLLVFYINKTERNGRVSGRANELTSMRVITSIQAPTRLYTNCA
jgi:hypothetical protein